MGVMMTSWPACAARTPPLTPYPNSAGDQPAHVSGWQSCTAEVGEDAAKDYANRDGPRSSWGMQTRTFAGDERAISPRLGFALCSAPAFPGLDGAGSPVLGRGENGIPHRVDRMHAIGNAVVPQIPYLIGRAILEAAA